MEPKKNWNKGVVALIVAVAVLASVVTTLLAVIFTSRDTVPKGYVPEGYISIDDAQARSAAPGTPPSAIRWRAARWSRGIGTGTPAGLPRRA